MIHKPLIHSGKKGMKWGYNDGKANGKRTAGELLYPQIKNSNQIVRKFSKDDTKTMKEAHAKARRKVMQEYEAGFAELMKRLDAEGTISEMMEKFDATRADVEQYIAFITSEALFEEKPWLRED